MSTVRSSARMCGRSSWPVARPMIRAATRWCGSASAQSWASIAFSSGDIDRSRLPLLSIVQGPCAVGYGRLEPVHLFGGTRSPGAPLCRGSLDDLLLGAVIGQSLSVLSGGCRMNSLVQDFLAHQRQEVAQRAALSGQSALNASRLTIRSR